RGKRRHRTGLDAEGGAQVLRLAEGKAARAADLAVQALEIDRRAFLGRQKEQAVLSVDEKQILGVRTGDLGAQVLRLLDGEERRVLDGRGRNAELGEESEEIVGGGGHYGRIALRRTILACLAFCGSMIFPETGCHFSGSCSAEFARRRDC